MKQHPFSQRFFNVLALIFIGITVACSSLQDDIDELQSEVNNLKETVAGLEEAQAESKVIKEVKELTDAAGWNLFFTDGTNIRLEDTISMEQDEQTKVITIVMPDGRVFTFNREEVYPTGIIVLNQKVALSPNSIHKIGFRVNPSNAEFNYDTESDEIAIGLDLIKSTRDAADSYITTPENYKLQKIEPAVNDEGKIKVGQYIAYIQDLGSLSTFRDKVALVLTTKDRSGNLVQYSSEVFEVTSGELPVVYLTTPGAQKITSKENWMADCVMEIVTPNGDDDIYLSNVSLRGRGNTTWGYPKKPYAIKLDKKAEVLGMPAHKRWVLLANWMDKTLLRNSVAFEIARKTGLEWTPRGTFVEVVLNGTHLGNYYLCEQIKVDKNRVNVAELKGTDTEEPAITGGYLVELDTYYDEINKFRTIHKNLPVNFKEPDEDVLNSQQMNWFRNYFNQIEDILYGSGEGSYQDYIDMNSFIDWWLVHELTFNAEPNHPKSSYMHKDRNGKLKAGPVWDFDYATFRPTNNANFRINNAIWYDKLFQYPDFVETVKQRWNTLKPGFQTIIPFINEQAAYIRQSAIVNGNMWPINQDINGDEKMSFDAAVNRLRGAYEERINTLDRLIGDL
ncbi:MAG: CotH kinase family protein [Proteiniphilum sp.]|uniref:CotH kinase family protein n=1 Tax=Proteiniphilum sp. TaxID=1926877 RepID=UPI002B21C7EF|nr:CotH kinase family protein [Proteiniphilum sp.]MEA5127283.1 CotH kinase family protein [Proteiniphilum sp.]